MNIHHADQGYAQGQGALDGLIKEWQASLARKKERHGDKFDHVKAFSHLYEMLTESDRKSLAFGLAAAVDRLAQMPAPTLPDELAQLDFDFDPEKEGE